MNKKQSTKKLGVKGKMQKPLKFQLHQDYLLPSSSKASDMKRPHILQVFQSFQVTDFQPSKANGSAKMLVHKNSFKVQIFYDNDWIEIIFFSIYQKF